MGGRWRPGKAWCLSGYLIKHTRGHTTPLPLCHLPACSHPAWSLNDRARGGQPRESARLPRKLKRLQTHRTSPYSSWPSAHCVSSWGGETLSSLSDTIGLPRCSSQLLCISEDKPWLLTSCLQAREALVRKSSSSRR